jgi:hypothetical protein
MSVIATIIDVAFDVGKYIARAIQEGDEAKWRPIADVLPEPLKSRLERIAQDTKTKNALEDIFDEK